jgi:hypothetical protein
MSHGTVWPSGSTQTVNFSIYDTATFCVLIDFSFSFSLFMQDNIGCVRLIDLRGAGIFAYLGERWSVTLCAPVSAQVSYTIVYAILGS